LQAQRQEFGFGQLIGETAAYLITVLRNAFTDDEMVILVVLIHILPR